MDNHTICGKTEINELNAAPAPIETNKAGRAQQIIVPPLVNKLMNEVLLDKLIASSSLFFFILISYSAN